MLNNTSICRVLTKKSDISHAQLDTQVLRSNLATGEVLLKIKRLALTTNNITYAAFGDTLQYWQFFPTHVDDWGHMPAWGFADVVKSTVLDIAEGERFYGFFPISSHLHMMPVRVTRRGFYDGSAHRQPLNSAYNQYTRCSADAAYQTTRENLQMLIRPLFLTSFMLADFLQDNAFFGATRVVISSASSKTASSTAFCLQDSPNIQILGITSKNNQDFVKKLGCYQNVFNYSELEQQSNNDKTLYIDFTGDTALRQRVHMHYADALVYDCFAGSTQNTDFLLDADLPGPKPVFYFAPVQIRKRNLDWGASVVNQRFNVAQLRFIDHLSQPDQNWINIIKHEGLSATPRLIQTLAAGHIDPHQGHVVLMD
jgi:Protein of unknown function (DUF2855)